MVHPITRLDDRRIPSSRSSRTSWTHRKIEKFGGYIGQLKAIDWKWPSTRVLLEKLPQSSPPNVYRVDLDAGAHLFSRSRRALLTEDGSAVAPGEKATIETR
jgi:hypothetical protein